MGLVCIGVSSLIYNEQKHFLSFLFLLLSLLWNGPLYIFGGSAAPESRENMIISFYIEG